MSLSSVPAQSISGERSGASQRAQVLAVHDVNFLRLRPLRPQRPGGIGCGSRVGRIGRKGRKGRRSLEFSGGQNCYKILAGVLLVNASRVRRSRIA
jgi:hypothetical protein